MSNRRKTSGGRTYENFLMSGTFTSGGVYHRVSPLNSTEHEYKNAFNTDIRRERGLEKETEDWGDT